MILHFLFLHNDTKTKNRSNVKTPLSIVAQKTCPGHVINFSPFYALTCNALVSLIVGLDDMSLMRSWFGVAQKLLFKATKLAFLGLFLALTSEDHCQNCIRTEFLQRKLS